MPVLAITFFIAMMAILVANHLPAQEQKFQIAKANVAATDVLAYREEVINFLNLNAGYSGTVTDAQITPLWGHQRRPNWSNVVSGGTLYIFEVSSAPEKLLLDQIYRKTSKSFFVGRNSGGILVSANGLNTGISIPVTVPNGAIVLIGK